MGLTWTDSEDIGIELVERHPGQDPLKVRFTELRDMVMALPGFEGTTEQLNEKKLEAIQMAWYEEFQEVQAED